MMLDPSLCQSLWFFAFEASSYASSQFSSASFGAVIRLDLALDLYCKHLELHLVFLYPLLLYRLLNLYCCRQGSSLDQASRCFGYVQFILGFIPRCFGVLSSSSLFCLPSLFPFVFLEFFIFIFVFRGF